jgi:hypothetical protein
MRAMICIISLLISGISTAWAVTPTIATAPNSIEFPADYLNWRVISASHRIDNESFRIILGNDIAIQAAREGHTNPWPDGTVLAKVVWKQVEEEHWKTAIAPGAFIHAEFMFRDTKRWAANGTGWGWARWVGNDLKPYGKDAGFSSECIACHTPVSSTGWVFTTPAVFPSVK